MIEHQDFKRHRIWIEISDTTMWYSVMREFQRVFGKDWKSESKIRKKLVRLEIARCFNPPLLDHVTVWFDVPDIQIATWIAIKKGLNVSISKPKIGKY